MKYTRLPEPPTRPDWQPTEHYAAVLFRFVLEYRCTATLDDEQIALAAYAGVRASAQASDAKIADRLTEVRHLIASAQRARVPEPGPEPIPAPSEPERLNAGPMAPLQPQPFTRPPSPSYAVPDDIAF